MLQETEKFLYPQLILLYRTTHAKFLLLLAILFLMRNDFLNEVMEEVTNFSMDVLQRGINFES